MKILSVMNKLHWHKKSVTYFANVLQSSAELLRMNTFLLEQSWASAFDFIFDISKLHESEFSINRFLQNK